MQRRRMEGVLRLLDESEGQPCSSKVKDSSAIMTLSRNETSDGAGGVGVELLGDVGMVPNSLNRLGKQPGLEPRDRHDVDQVCNHRCTAMS